MLLSLDRIPRLHNILASFFTWILLAGYIVFPATFTSLSDNTRLQDHSQDANAIEKKILEGVRNAPLLYVAAVCCGVGCLGCIWLWWKWRKNYVRFAFPPNIDGLHTALQFLGMTLMITLARSGSSTAYSYLLL